MELNNMGKIEMEHVKTNYICSHCGEKLWFDGTGCYCDNKDCIVYNGYVLTLKQV